MEAFFPGEGKKLAIDSKPTLTFFSNVNDLFRNAKAAVEQCAAWLNEATERLSGHANILVRLHPNEDGSIYRKASALKVFNNECDVGTTLAGSNVIGCLWSTALMEGLLYEKPVLQFFADAWPDLADNWRRGLAKRVSSVDSLVHELSNLLDGRYRDALAMSQQRLTSQVLPIADRLLTQLRDTS